MMEDADKVLALFGLKLINAVVAAFVSTASLRFFDGLSTRDRWYTFLGGWAMAAWGAAPLREYLELKQAIEVGVVIVLGLFGMAVAAEAVKLVRDMDWRGLVGRIVGRKNVS